MEGGCTLVQPSQCTGEGIPIRRCALPFSLYQLDTPAPEDVNSGKDLHNRSADHPLDGHDKDILCTGALQLIDEHIYTLLVHHRVDGNEPF